MKIKSFILFLVLSVNYSVSAQDYKCYSCETGFPGEYFEIFTLHDSVIVIDTVYVGAETLLEMSKNSNISYDEFVHHFFEYVKEKKQDSLTSIEEQIYISHLLADVNKQVKKYRYVLNKYWLDFPNDSVEIRNKETSLPQNIPDSMVLDFLFVLEGKKNTSNFLNSPSEQLKVLYKLVLDISERKKKTADKKIKNRIALNFYFPDFSFEEKRAMAQFVKSVSLVIDSIKVDEIRNLPLYFTFHETAKKDNMAYLVGLCDMVDNIFVADTSSQIISFEAIDKNAAISKFEKIKNQFYLVRFHTDDFPEITGDLSSGNIERLMNADYPNTWEGYFAGIIGIILLLIIGTVCYFFITPFTNFIHEHYMYVFAGVIILITEIILLFVFMIEEMNSHTKVFNLWEILLVLILLVIVIPLIKKGISNKETP